MGIIYVGTIHRGKWPSNTQGRRNSVDVGALLEIKFFVFFFIFLVLSLRFVHSSSTPMYIPRGSSFNTPE